MKQNPSPDTEVVLPDAIGLPFRWLIVQEVDLSQFGDNSEFEWMKLRWYWREEHGWRARFVEEVV